jgi:tetratricopeptide (TPR) repeat protein
MDFKRIYFSLILIVAFFSVSYAFDLIGREIVNYFNEGVRAQKAVNFDAAHTAYTKALLLAPENPTYAKLVYNNLGVLLIQQNDILKAETNLKKALKLDPGYKTAQFNLWLLYEIKGDRAEALGCWAKAFDLDETKPQEFLIKDGPWTDPNDPIYQRFVVNGMGVLCALRSDNGKAEENFKEALKIDPYYKVAQMNLALIYEANNDRAAALEYWAKAFDVQQRKPKAFMMTDDSPEGTPKDGHPEIEGKISWDNPKDPAYQKFIFNNMGVINATRSDIAAAEADFKEALKIDSNYRPAQMNLGLLYDMKKDRANALEYWLKVFNVEQLKPKTFVLDLDYEQAHEREKSADEATIPWRSPKDPGYQKFILNNMGIIYALRSVIDRAEDGFKEALSMDPNYRPAQLNLGLIYEKKKDRIEALEYWAKIFDKDGFKPKDFVVEGERKLGP